MALISCQGLGTSGQPSSGNSIGTGLRKPIFAMNAIWVGMPT